MVMEYSGSLVQCGGPNVRGITRDVPPIDTSNDQVVLGRGSQDPVLAKPRLDAFHCGTDHVRYELCNEVSMSVSSLNKHFYYHIKPLKLLVVNKFHIASNRRSFILKLKCLIPLDIVLTSDPPNGLACLNVSRHCLRARTSE